MSYPCSASARERLRRFGQKRALANSKYSLQHIPASMQSITSGVSSRTSSPVNSMTHNPIQLNVSIENEASTDSDSPKHQNSTQQSIHCLLNLAASSVNETKEVKSTIVPPLEVKQNENSDSLLCEENASNSCLSKNERIDNFNHATKELKNNQIIVSATIHGPI